MAVDAGKVAVNPRGVFSSSATYERLDVVTYQSNTYVALQTTQGNLPTDTSSWAPWVKLDNASMTVRGLVKVDGTSITADADGTIHGHAAAGVNSFNGREGDVLPELGDYDANQIAYDNSNSNLDSTDVNDAIDELAEKAKDKVIFLKNKTCSAMTGNFLSEINADITSDHVVVDVVFANPSAITGDVTWHTYDYVDASTPTLTFNGTCASATTATITLVKKDN